jgi:hypothetical protein
LHLNILTADIPPTSEILVMDLVEMGILMYESNFWFN